MIRTNIGVSYCVISEEGLYEAEALSCVKNLQKKILNNEYNDFLSNVNRLNGYGKAINRRTPQQVNIIWSNRDLNLLFHNSNHVVIYLLRAVIMRTIHKSQIIFKTWIL